LRKKILLGFMSLCVGLVLAELLLAIFFPMETYDRARQNNPPIYQSSDILPYQLRPGAAGSLVRPEFSTTVHINSHGHRGEEFNLEKDGRFRILAIGDSFTFGWGSDDDETYPAQLERSLRHRTGDPRIEVINAGFAAAYYPDTYYLYLKHIGVELAPDLVLVGFFLGNDVDHVSFGENRWPAVDEAGLPLAVSGAMTASDDGFATLRLNGRRHRYPVLRNSHLFQLAALAYRLRRLGAPQHNEWMYRAEYAPRTEEAVRNVEKLLLATAEVAREADVPLLIVMFPAREQLRPEAYDIGTGTNRNGLDLEKPQRIFARFFKENDIDHLDLLPAFRARYSADTLYFPHDGHWTPRGNEVASEIIADYLVAEGAVR